MENSHLRLFDASNGVVDRNSCLPFQPFCSVFCPLGVELLLAVGNHRLQAVHVGWDFRFEGIPVCRRGIFSRFDFLIDLFCRCLRVSTRLLPARHDFITRLLLSGSCRIFGLFGANREVVELLRKRLNHLYLRYLKAASPSK